jgi:hypothetical protein
MRPHALRDRFDFVHVTVEGDQRLMETLRAAGAEVMFDIVRMGGSM